MRRCSGFWPPSKPRRGKYPRRAFWPLLPAPAVFPSFEPIPRPTRTFLMREPRGGRRFDKLNAGRPSFFFASDRPLRGPDFGAFFAISIPVSYSTTSLLFNDDDKVTHFVNHAADRRRIFALDGVVQAAQTEAANRLTDVIGRADETDDLLDFDGALCSGLFFFLFRIGAHELPSAPAAAPPFCFGDLPRISSTVFERVSATCAMSFRLSSAAKVAFTTLCGFEVPSDLVST